MMLGGCRAYKESDGDSSGFVDPSIKINVTQEEVKDFHVNISLWSPITGPDSGYLQNLVTAWNANFGKNVKLSSDPLQENAHYTRLITSMSDNSTADLVMIHRSRVAQFQRTGKMRDMTSILAKAEIKKESYLSTFWDSNIFDGKNYALTYDLLPTLMYYNKKLIPSGYSEADIKNGNFTLEDMMNMMKLAYQGSPQPSKTTYGLAFNYAYTENPFLTFLYQQGGKPVDISAPTIPTYNDEKGVNAATGLRDLPFTKNADNKIVASDSGTDHLNVFGQGRGLFTIDGLWQSSTAIVHNDRVDTGLAFLPKLNASSESRTAYADSHCFTIFNTSSVNEQKDAAISLLLKYFVGNTSYWCKGGKAAVRNDTLNDEEYKALEWSFVSESLDKIQLPENVYTNNAITSPIGEYCSKLCEGTLTDVAAALNEAAKKSKELAEKQQ